MLTYGWTFSSWYNISDGWNAVVIDWMASSEAEADSGYMKLWLDDTLKETISSVDNDTQAASRTRLGAWNA